MQRLAPGHGRNDARHLALRYGTLDDLIDLAEYSRVETVTVGHAATLWPALAGTAPLDQEFGGAVAEILGQ